MAPTLLLLVACSSPPADGELVSARVRTTTDAWTHYDVTYGSDGLRIEGQVVFPAGAGPFPIVLVNHGGFDGIPEATERELQRLAERGYAAFGSEYRGEGGSQGEVEYCYGEVHDVLNLLRVADDWRATDRERVATVGTSHGACIGLMAAASSRRLGGVVGMGTPSDVDEHIAWHHERGNHRFAERWEDYVEDMGRSMSPMYHADDVDAPILLLHGVDDVTVPLLQACRMRDAMASHVETASYRLDADGQPVVGPLDDCQGEAMAGDWLDAAAMTAGAVLVSVEAEVHKPSPAQWDRAAAALDRWLR